VNESIFEVFWKSGQLFVTGFFAFYAGPHAWPLPAVQVDYPEGLDLHRWFGRYFLEGLACPKLQQFTEHLLIKPSIMVKSWAKCVHNRARILCSSSSSLPLSFRQLIFLFSACNRQLRHSFKLSSREEFPHEPPWYKHGIRTARVCSVFSSNMCRRKEIRNKNFTSVADLLLEYIQWLPQGYRAQAAALWPPK
jgi:hypothetical protein